MLLWTFFVFLQENAMFFKKSEIFLKQVNFLVLVPVSLFIRRESCMKCVNMDQKVQQTGKFQYDMSGNWENQKDDFIKVLQQQECSIIFSYFLFSQKAKIQKKGYRKTKKLLKFPFFYLEVKDIQSRKFQNNTYINALFFPF